jgi:hypothetical protein
MPTLVLVRHAKAGRPADMDDLDRLLPRGSPTSRSKVQAALLTARPVINLLPLLSGQVDQGDHLVEVTRRREQPTLPVIVSRTVVDGSTATSCNTSPIWSRYRRPVTRSPVQHLYPTVAAMAEAFQDFPRRNLARTVSARATRRSRRPPR